MRPAEAQQLAAAIAAQLGETLGGPIGLLAEVLAAGDRQRRWSGASR